MVTVSKEHQDIYDTIRLRGQDRIFKLGVISIGLGFLSTVIGAVALYYAWDYKGFPFIVGASLWSGAMVFVVGVFGYITSRQDHNDPKPTLKYMVVGYFVLSMVAMFLSLGSVGLNAFGASLCKSIGESGYLNCLPDVQANFALAVVSCVLGFILAVFSMFGTCFFCCYGRSYELIERHERQQTRMAVQMQNLRNERDSRASNQNHSNSYVAYDNYGAS